MDCAKSGFGSPHHRLPDQKDAFGGPAEALGRAAKSGTNRIGDFD